ncbi:MAG: O-antigen ligase family protein [Bacteroidales bacterium]|nr:O-antigen ligase family protein [Bacteroidales bacterium]
MQIKTGEWPPRYTTLYFVSLALLIASLPLSRFTMSLFQFSTLLFWLWHGVNTEFLKKYSSLTLFNPANLIRFLNDVFKNVFNALVQKFLEFFRNKPAIAIASLFFLHGIGLIYTSDYEYAWNDLRTKLPLLTLPLFIATGPRISTRLFYRMLAIFVLAVIAGSIYRLILFLNLPVADSRDLSAHISHIRYSLNAVFAIFILLFFVYKKKSSNSGITVVLLIGAIWLIYFITYMNYTTGMLIFIIISALLLPVLTFRSKGFWPKTSMLLSMGLLIILPILYILSVGYKYVNIPAVDFSQLDKFTPRGNSYYHDTVNFKSRNGKWTGLYICDKELRQEWAKRSRLSLEDYNEKRQINRYTLLKYLASKELRKDADGMGQLGDSDIRNIEKGIDRYDYTRLPGIRSQVEDFINSYQRYVEHQDPNSSSMVQRFEYWRTSLLLIRQNPVWGVGTGDVPNAFKDQYQKMNTNLAEQYRGRSHNQYLSVTVAFGILGLIWFMAVMFYPGMKTKNFNNYFYVIFWLILMLSMLTENTIEKQEGVTFYILFTSLMILGRKNKESSESLYT